jgi:hypothetical protein
MRARPAVVVLVVWTLFVWSTRFGTIWSDEDLSTAGKLGRTALALSFTLLAVAVAAAAWRAGPATLRSAVLALAGWTTMVWAVRSVGIVAGDHDLGFKVVHVVLAVVSVLLAAWAARSVSRTTQPEAMEVAGQHSRQ